VTPAYTPAQVTVDLDGSSKDPVVNFFGVKAEDAPIVLGFEMAKNKKYRMKTDVKCAFEILEIRLSFLKTPLAGWLGCLLLCDT
jgi:hypothetical protein